MLRGWYRAASTVAGSNPAHAGRESLLPICVHKAANQLASNLPDPNSGHDSFVVVLDISIARQAPAARNPLELNGFFAIHTRAQSDEIITATCFRSKERRV